MTVGWLPSGESPPPRVEVEVRHQDILAATAHETPPAEAEELVLGSFLREALERGFESLALPVSEHGLGVTLPVVTRLLAGLTGERRPLLRHLQLLAREADLLDGWQAGVA